MFKQGRSASHPGWNRTYDRDDVWTPEALRYRAAAAAVHDGSRTSADGDGEVPDGDPGRVGDAGEQRVAVQHVARHAAVADLVSHAEVRSVQDALGRDTWVTARAAAQLWGTQREQTTRISLIPSTRLDRAAASC